MVEGLPEFCYARHDITGEWVIIKRGEMGYFPTDWGKASQEAIDYKNQQMGITKAQAEAMLLGSMVGWDVPRANPACYDENGLPVKAKARGASLQALKEQVVKKIQGEYREFHDQLLEMSKAEILNHTWEILIKEEITVQIENTMDSNDYTEGQLQNMLATDGLLQDLFKACDDIPTVDPLIDCIENYFETAGEQALSSLESEPDLNIKPPVQEKACKTKGLER